MRMQATRMWLAGGAHRYGHPSDFGTAVLAAALTFLVLSDEETLASGLVHDYGTCLAVGLAGSLSFLVRRRWPLLCAATAVASTLVTDDRTLMVFAVYALALYGGRFRYPVCVAMAVAYQAVRYGTGALTGWEVLTDVRGVVSIAITAVIGELMRRRNELIELLRHRLAQVELSVEQAGEHTVLQERHRISSGLHENLAHEGTALVLHAENLLRLPGLPEAARPSLLAVQAGARRVMADVRESAKVLQGRREELDPGTVARISYTELLASMVRNMETIGVDMAFESTGTPRELPVRVEQAMYRVAMEALAGAAKHAPDAPVVVRLRFTDDVTEFEVDSGALRSPWLPDDPLARGLDGLREVVTAAGGTLTACRENGDRYVLRARFAVGSRAFPGAAVLDARQWAASGAG
ncbi:sensor histidine kinase [Streptomyces gamaensis]|uniref:histidine kinase n=1 Tax=Streptomyces gamaensis TaxID=1763542 RepID=A0ABW0Z0G6_9ACTN